MTRTNNTREEETDEDVHSEDEEHQRDQPTHERKAEGEHSIQEEVARMKYTSVTSQHVREVQ